MEDRQWFALKRLGSRCWFGFLFIATLAAIGWMAWLLPPYIKARVYDYRVRHGRLCDAHMIALGRLHHPAGEAILERYACELDAADPWAERATFATWALREYYPDSRVARGVAQYAAIRGGSGAGSPATLETRVIDKTRLRDWISRYSPHPSTDDAYLVLARETEQADPIEALRLLHAGFHSPDGDAHDEIANRFQMILERRTTTDQLEDWLRSDCPSHVASNVAYVAGIKRMREGRYLEALPLFERFLTSLAVEQPELRGDPIPGGQHYDSRWWENWVTIPEKRWQLANRQLQACRWFSEQENQIAAELDPESCATILHAMARRCFQSRDLFVNCFYYEMVFTEDAESRAEIGILDISLDNNYRQAAEMFLRMSREYPNYSQREAVQYSIPLCLWRVRTAFPLGGARLDQAIYCGFQAFAHDYPSSSMADDALYLAGIHHWMSTDLDSCSAALGRDSSVIESNMCRIATDYADGDVIQRYGESNRWLQKAALARRFEHNPSAARVDWVRISLQLRAWRIVLRTVGGQCSRNTTRPGSHYSDTIRR